MRCTMQCIGKILSVGLIIFCVSNANAQLNSSGALKQSITIENDFVFKLEALKDLHERLRKQYNIPKGISLRKSIGKIVDAVEDLYGDESKDYVQALVLFNLMETEDQSERTTSIVSKFNWRAIHHAEELAVSAPEYAALAKMHIAGRLIPAFAKRRERATRLLEEVRQFYLTNSEEFQHERLQVNLYLARRYHYRADLASLSRKQDQAKRYYTLSENLMLENLSILEKSRASTTPMELYSRATLIYVMEQTGQTERATEQCVAIGAMQPWSDSQFQTPLFRMDPIIPRRNSTKQASVMLEFTISKFGTVKDIEVIRSNGGPEYERNSIAAVEGWRYAPKFEDGEPTEARTKVELTFSPYN